MQSYADLFTGKLAAAAQSGETLLYRVTDAGFAPMPDGGSAVKALKNWFSCPARCR